MLGCTERARDRLQKMDILHQFWSSALRFDLDSRSVNERSLCVQLLIQSFHRLSQGLFASALETSLRMHAVHWRRRVECGAPILNPATNPRSVCE
eukprot:6213139-Pleurochrysis_carterae.AAC.2